MWNSCLLVGISLFSILGTLMRGAEPMMVRNYIEEVKEFIQLGPASFKPFVPSWGIESRFSQPWHNLYFGPDNSSLWEVVLSIVVLSSILVSTYQMPITIPQLWQPKISIDIVKCLSSVEKHWCRLMIKQCLETSCSNISKQ